MLLLARAKACRPFQNRHSNEGCISPIVIPAKAGIASALLRLALRHQSEELSPSFGGRGTSLLLVQKRSAQEKTTPRLALAAAQGPRVEQRAIVARTFQKIQDKTRAGANNRHCCARLHQCAGSVFFRMKGGHHATSLEQDQRSIAMLFAQA
jgi:hypothetical protein